MWLHGVGGYGRAQIPSRYLGAHCLWHGTIQMRKEKWVSPHKLGPFSCVPDLNLKNIRDGLVLIFDSRKTGIEERIQ